MAPLDDLAPTIAAPQFGRLGRGRHKQFKFIIIIIMIAVSFSVNVLYLKSCLGPTSCWSFIWPQEGIQAALRQIGWFLLRLRVKVSRAPVMMMMISKNLTIFFFFQSQLHPNCLSTGVLVLHFNHWNHSITLNTSVAGPLGCRLSTEHLAGQFR